MKEDLLEKKIREELQGLVSIVKCGTDEPDLYTTLMKQIILNTYCQN